MVVHDKVFKGNNFYEEPVNFFGQVELFVGLTLLNFFAVKSFCLS